MSVSRRKGSPYWQYSFVAHGVRFRGSTGCTEKRKAERVEAEKRVELENRRSREAPWRLRDCFGAYWQDHARHSLDSDAIFRKLELLSEQLGKDTPIADLTNANVMDYRAARVRQGVAAPSVNRDIAYLKAALRWANTMHGKQIPALAWRQLRVAEPPHRTRFLNQQEFAQLLEACEPELQRIVKVAVATGLRKANLLQLDWSQVDLPSGQMTVIVKGNKRHSVKLTAATKAALVAGVEERKGKVFDTTNFRKRWDAAVEKAGLRDFRFHDLRHTCATWMRMAGADLADICEALGHSSVSVTMRYAHIEPENHVTAFDRISARVWTQGEALKGKTRQKS